MRYKARQAVQQIEGVVAALAADVHMLAKDRGLLRQIAKMLDGFDIARIVADLLALPGMKGVRTAAADLQMMAQRRALNRLLDGAELGLGMADVAAHPGGDLQHALGDVVFGFSHGQLMLDVGNQRRGILAKVVTRRVHHLQLQFDTEGKRIGAVKIG